MTESLFYIQRIRAQYDTGIFSKSDKRIADYLLEHPGAVDAETASSIAEKEGGNKSGNSRALLPQARLQGPDGYEKQRRIYELY